MTLKEIRAQWETGREVLMALATPTRDKVFVLLHNQYNKADYREEYSIFEYTQDKEGNWTVWFNPNFSEFEHLEQGLQYLNSKFSSFLPK
jgi:hypothetical protein